MTTDLHTLAAAVVQSPRWRWCPGMLAAGPAGPKGGRKRARVESRFADDITPKCVDFNGRRVPAAYACICEANEVVPDLSDPATLGCLLALVREAWGPLAHLVRFATHVQPNGPGTDFAPAMWWALCMTDTSTPEIVPAGERLRYLAGPSEPAALVAALLAAPPPESAG